MLQRCSLVRTPYLAWLEIAFSAAAQVLQAVAHYFRADWKSSSTSMLHAPMLFAFACLAALATSCPTGSKQKHAKIIIKTKNPIVKDNFLIFWVLQGTAYTSEKDAMYDQKALRKWAIRHIEKSGVHKISEGKTDVK